jgi:hypothetical protein
VKDYSQEGRNSGVARRLAASHPLSVQVAIASSSSSLSSREESCDVLKKLIHFNSNNWI